MQIGGLPKAYYSSVWKYKLTLLRSLRNPFLTAETRSHFWGWECPAVGMSACSAEDCLSGKQKSLHQATLRMSYGYFLFPKIGQPAPLEGAAGKDIILASPFWKIQLNWLSINIGFGDICYSGMNKYLSGNPEVYVILELWVSRWDKLPCFCECILESIRNDPETGSEGEYLSLQTFGETKCCSILSAVTRRRLEGALFIP